MNFYQFDRLRRDRLRPFKFHGVKHVKLCWGTYFQRKYKTKFKKLTLPMIKLEVEIIKTEAVIRQINQYIRRYV